MNMSVRGLRVGSRSLFYQQYYYRGVAILCPLRYYSGGTPIYYNPLTWPTTLSAPEIKRLLDSHLVNPGEEPNYESLAMMLQANYISAVNLVVRKFIKPPQRKVDLEKYLKEHLDPNAENADMQLEERTPQIERLDVALARKPGSEKREVAFSYSPRWSGKTQFLKRFVFEKRAEAMKCGRVIVRCCDKEDASWLKTVQDDSKSDAHAAAAAGVNSTDKGFCELIRTHVEAVTGSPQDETKYCDPPTAYATWISETAWWFGIPQNRRNVDPLIIIDNCEILANQQHKSLMHISRDSTEIALKPYTLLEAFCLAMPSPHAMVFFGSNAIDNTSDRFFLTMANMTNIGPLLPLSKKGSGAAMITWKESNPISEATGSVSQSPRTEVTPMWLHLLGGVPHLLRALFMTGVDNLLKARKSLGDNWFPQVYTCLLASSTKARVDGNAVIAVNPKWNAVSSEKWTYHDAMIHSVGLYDSHTGRFMVPPIRIMDTDMKGKRVPILPSQLHPLLNNVSIKEKKKVCQKRGASSEVMLVKSFLWALYARYLLASWEVSYEQKRLASSTKPCKRTLRKTAQKWVSLAKVFDGAVNLKQVAVLERYEVNLSRGVKPANRRVVVENAVTDLDHKKRVNAHYDACIWCRDIKNKMGAFAVPLQLPPSNSEADVRKLLRKKTKKKMPLVLSVDFEPREIFDGHMNSVVMIDGNELSSTGWMWKPK